MTQEEINNTNWSQSVAGVCIRDGKVLLARHTYGNGNGMLIIPGGYVKFGEVPQETMAREFLEETGVQVTVEAPLGALPTLAELKFEKLEAEDVLEQFGAS